MQATLEADRREHEFHQKMKNETKNRLRKRKREVQEEKSAMPAYERESMHGQSIAISVGPCSLPENQRTTYSRIPDANAKWR